MQKRVSPPHDLQNSSYQFLPRSHDNIINRHLGNVSETKIFEIFSKPQEGKFVPENRFRRQSCCCKLCGSVSQHSKWLNQYQNIPAMHTKIEQRKNLAKRFQNACKVLISMIRFKNIPKKSNKKKLMQRLKTKINFEHEMYRSNYQEQSPFIEDNRMVKTIAQSSPSQVHQQGQFIQRYVINKIQSNTIATLIHHSPLLRIDTLIDERLHEISTIKQRIQTDPDQHVKSTFEDSSHAIRTKKSQNIYLRASIPLEPAHKKIVINSYYLPIGKCVNISMYQNQNKSK